MITLDDIRTALSLPAFDALAAHRLMSPGLRRLFPPDGVMPRQSAVLVLLYPEAGDLHIVLTRRTDTLRGHSGQISFPGGRRDPQDESFTATALRETCEELGVCSDDIDILGALTSIYIPPSNFEVYPMVGALTAPPVFRPSPDEVAEVFSLSLCALLDATLKYEEVRNLQGVEMSVPYYGVNGHQVWGATAIMLSEFEQRLRAVLPPERLMSVSCEPR